MRNGEHNVHKAASVGFQQAADAYDRGRPDYPPEAIQFITEQFQLGPDHNVVDLGAGTGKFTALIAPTGAHITAVEPVEAMRDRLIARLPLIEALSGTAQAIPLKSATQDLVFAAQAFHWFANEESLAEIRRILKPHGQLVLIWNVRDESVDWVHQLTEIINPYQGDAPRFRSGEWRKALEATSLFGELRSESFPYEFTYSAQGVIDRFLSVSFIAALPEPEQVSIANKVSEVVQQHCIQSGSVEIVFPYRTEVYSTVAS